MFKVSAGKIVFAVSSRGRGDFDEHATGRAGLEESRLTAARTAAWFEIARRQAVSRQGCDGGGHIRHLKTNVMESFAVLAQFLAERMVRSERFDQLQMAAAQI